MTPTVIALILVLPLSGPVFVDLPEALEASRSGESLRGRVNAEIAQEATTAIREAEQDEDLEHLIQVARLGDPGPFASALLSRCLRNPPLPALRALARVDPGWVESAIEAQPGWPELLATWVKDPTIDLPRGEAAATLLAHHGPPTLIREVLDFLSDWPSQSSRARQLTLLRECGQNESPARMLRLLATGELDPSLADAAGYALQQLLAQETAATPAVVEILEEGDPGPLLIRALGAAPPGLQTRVSSLVRARLGESPEPWLLGTAIQLGVSDLRGRVVELALDGDERTRVAALTALPNLDPTEDADAQDLAIEAVRVALHEDDSPRVQVAGIATAARLGLVDLLPYAALERLTSPAAATAVREAAIRALPWLRRGDPVAIDLLISLLDDGEVGLLAWRTLRTMTGLRLPQREVLWRAWQDQAVNRDRPRLYASQPVVLDQPSPSPRRGVPGSQTTLPVESGPAWPSSPSLVLGFLGALSLVVIFGATSIRRLRVVEDPFALARAAQRAELASQREERVLSQLLEDQEELLESATVLGTTMRFKGGITWRGSRKLLWEDPVASETHAALEETIGLDLFRAGLEELKANQRPGIEEASVKEDSARIDPAALDELRALRAELDRPLDEPGFRAWTQRAQQASVPQEARLLLTTIALRKRSGLSEGKAGERFETLLGSLQAPRDDRAERLLETIASLEAALRQARAELKKLNADSPTPTTEGGTVDVATLFPSEPAGSHATPPPIEGATVDIQSLFPDASAPATPPPPPPDDEGPAADGTVDISELFPS